MNIILAGSKSNCELCNGEAAIYCPSDTAFLCWSCDAEVHDANFLVARHLRNAICSKCKDFTAVHLSGAVPHSNSVINIHCSSCCSPSQSSSSSSSSSSSACVSSTTSSSPATKKIDSRKFNDNFIYYYRFCHYSGQEIAPRNKSRSKTSAGSSSRRRWLSSRLPSRLDFKAEGIFVNWCRRLGCPVPGDVEAAVLLVSRKALSISWDYMAAAGAALPLKLCLAASLWFGLRFCGYRSVAKWQLLKGLEEISGIPARLILAATRKLWRQIQPRQLEEGWAECSA